MSKILFKLVVDEGPEKGTTFILTEEQSTIGRGENNSFCLLDTAVSKTHCRVLKTDDKAFLVDLGSKNGTILDGQRIAANRKYQLRAGSLITIGNSVIKLAQEEKEDGSLAGASKEIMEETTLQIARAKLRPVTGAGRRIARQETVPFYINSNKNLSTIYKVLNTIGSVMDWDFLVTKSLDLIFGAIQAERGYIFLTETLKGNVIKPAAEKTRLAGEEFSPDTISRTVIVKVLEEGNTILGTEVAQDAMTARTRSGAAGTRSIVCAPIKTKERLLGLIYFDTTREGESFKKDDVELLTSIGIYLGSMMENAQLHQDYQDLFLGIIKTLINIIEAKDKYTLGHSERVAKISLAIGEELELDLKDIESLQISSLMHDIGKVAVPEEVLNKPGKLSDPEWEMIKKHPSVGAGFVRHLNGFGRFIDGIMYHHERFDGKGYPTGSAGKSIPFIARIIAVADTFDAMTSDRAYRKRFTEKEALDEILRCRGTQFDDQIVAAFHRGLRRGKISRVKAETAANIKI